MTNLVVCKFILSKSEKEVDIRKLILSRIPSYFQVLALIRKIFNLGSTHFTVKFHNGQEYLDFNERSVLSYFTSSPRINLKFFILLRKEHLQKELELTLQSEDIDVLFDFTKPQTETESLNEEQFEYYPLRDNVAEHYPFSEDYYRAENRLEDSTQSWKTTQSWKSFPQPDESESDWKDQIKSQEEDIQEIDETLFEFYLKDSIDKYQEQMQLAFLEELERKKINDLRISKEDEDFWKEIDEENMDEEEDD